MVILKGKYGDLGIYFNCEHCGIPVSSRLNRCPMCHREVRRDYTRKRRKK